MAGLAFGEVAVVEVEIPYQGAVIERSPIDVAHPTADQGAVTMVAELIDVRPDHARGFTRQRTNGAAQRVEDAHLELLASVRAEGFKAHPFHEFRHPFYPTHDILFGNYSHFRSVWLHS